MKKKQSAIEYELKKLGNRSQAEILQRFFKTGPGEYGEGDQFLGIRVPVLRRFVREHTDISLAETAKLLRSPYHEIRLTALFLLIRFYKKGDEALKKKIVRLYLRSMKYINNWDLVDLSAPNIIGDYLLTRDRQILYKLIRSSSLWKRRVAVLATFALIRQNDFRDTLRLAEMTMDDQEDLMHKAKGWMLREIGKRDKNILKAFLDLHAPQMPRTMLRYAIEKFPGNERKAFLKKTVPITGKPDKSS